jgi:thiopurine S-methyltransferase
MLAKHVNKLIGGKSSAKILFPFCGKSLDMNWLASQGHEIVGVEFVEDAVLQFFAEQNIKYEVKEVENFKLFTVIHLNSIT